MVPKASKIEDLILEICRLCGGKKMPHCDSEIQGICLNDYLRRNPQVVVVATVLAPVNPAGQRALSRYEQIIEGMQKVPRRR